MKNNNIAIDGPAGAGKSTVAKLVAKKLGYLYIDTGAMYRALTLQAIKLGIDLHDEYRLNEFLISNPIKLINTETGQKVEMAGEDLTNNIRSPEVSNNVSLVAAHSLIRKTMVELQQKLAESDNVVMDGRDIGTNVLPDAKLKIFLTASIEERAKRRYQELIEKGYKSDLNDLINEISGRDQKDQERKVAPLKKADDAILIETSNLSINDVVDKILLYAKERLRDEN